MIKKRIIAVITGIALLVAVTGASGIVADALGLSMTAQAYACENPGGSGGC
jgi:hypothetical protein